MPLQYFLLTDIYPALRNIKLSFIFTFLCDKTRTVEKHVASRNHALILLGKD